MSEEHSTRRWRGIYRFAVVPLLLAAAGCYPSMRFFYRPVLTAASADFMAALSVATGNEVVDGNTVTLLENGDETFPSMLDEISKAKSSIHLETYIFRDGTIGRMFVSALAERARAGVDVRLLLDAIGSSEFGDRNRRRLEQAGATVVFFRPIRLFSLSKVHLRTHRKVLIVDGRIGFTGGLCFEDAWMGAGDRPELFRDTQIRVEGPVVRQMQAAFARAWLGATGRLLSGRELYPDQVVANGVSCQLMDSTPGVAVNPAKLSFLVSVESARRSLDVTNPYFVPDHATRDALIRAAKRGVRVRLLLSGPHTDVKSARYAGRRHFNELLEAGVSIWEYAPARLHAKTFVADERWASVGSTNLNRRSFAWNYESNINVFDEAFAAEMEAMFERDLEVSTRVELAAWRKRSLAERLRESFYGLFRQQL